MVTARVARRVALVGAALVTIAAAAPARLAPALWHVQLVKSDPAANDTLATAPKAIQLWFSETVELPITRVKLADDAGAAVPLAPLTRDAARGAPVAAAITKPLAAGSYVVTWSTAAADGHAAKGSFGFVVKATR
jgi:copper resistance protein C